MENNETQAEQTAEVVETETKQESVKTFTQEEVNTLIAKEKARAKKNNPSKEEMEEFNVWKESKKTDAEKQAEREKHFQGIETTNNRLKKENMLLKRNITNDDDIDYIIYTLSKRDGDFEENLNVYLEENPKYTAQKEQTKATGVVNKPQNPVEKDSGVSAILKAKHPELFNK